MNAHMDDAEKRLGKPVLLEEFGKRLIKGKDNGRSLRRPSTSCATPSSRPPTGLLSTPSNRKSLPLLLLLRLSAVEHPPCKHAWCCICVASSC